MKSDKNILVAFLLNLGFSIFEFVGGALTGSVAILSDALHDIGDAASIGAAYFLERKSKKQPDETYSYGYARFSVVGSTITTLILLVGSLFVIYNAIMRIIHPTPIHYDGMIFMAVFGVIVNLVAAWFTREGESMNQKAVNLHMLEDVLGWVVVLLGAVIMRFTDVSIIDPLLSIGVAVFILINACKNLKDILDIILVKTPDGVDTNEIQHHVSEIPGVRDVHHIHIWSMDGHNHYASMHIVADGEAAVIKQKVREELREHGIGHVTLELETPDEHCQEKECHVEHHSGGCHHHHHHHHHGSDKKHKHEHHHEQDHKHHCDCGHDHKHEHHHH